MNKTLTVGEVARRSGIAVSTLRYYEEKGLITSWRTEGNQRRYDRGVLRRVAIIRIAKRAGISLKIIKDYFDRLPQSSVSREDWEAISAEWYSMLNERITSLLQLRDELKGCIGCGCLSLDECPLRNPQDILGEEGPGARLLDGENEQQHPE